MTRAYIRKDPRLFERKVVEQAYPMGAYATFEAILCLAEEQPERGRFRSERLLRLLLDEPRDGVRLGWGRWVAYLVENHDLVRQPDGSLYVDGWDEWQEGDVTVKERMQRLRGRRDRNHHRNADRNHHRNAATDGTVNIPSEPLAVSRKPLAVSESGSTSATRFDQRATLPVAVDARDGVA